MFFRKKIKIFLPIVFITLTGLTWAKDNDQKKAQHYNEIGWLKIKEKHYQEAEKYLLQAISLNPKVKFYYNNYAVACLNQGKNQEALSYLKICVALDPYYAKAFFNMALAYFYLFEFKKAYQAYQKTVEVDKVYAKQRFKIPKAIDKVEKVYQQHPENKALKIILDSMKSEFIFKKNLEN